MIPGLNWTDIKK